MKSAPYSELGRKARVRLPQPNAGALSPIVSFRLGKELREWAMKAAYLDGRSLSQFIRNAVRKEADRVMGYDRNYQRSRPPLRRSEALEAEEAHMEKFDTSNRRPTTEDGE